MANYYNNPGNINTPQAVKNAESITLTDKPIDSGLAKRVHDKLVNARVNLLFNHPFFGNLSTRLKLKPADDWLHTAAVDGVYFYYNHQFIDMLAPEELRFLFGHEVLHLVYSHLERQEGRNAMVVDEQGGLHSLHNIAADYVVNLELAKNNMGKIITTVPILYDQKYDNWASEAIYDHLYEQAKKNSQNKGMSGLPGSGTGLRGLEGEAGKLLDEHLTPDKQGDGQGNKDGKGGPVPMSAEDRQAMRDNLRDAIMSAAQSAGAGTLPAGVERLLNQLESPKMDWRTLLRTQLESTVLSDFSYLRPSRTAWHLDAILPGMVVDQLLKIAVAIDMSGSISTEQARDFISEVVGIMDQFPNYEILVMTYDTEVYNPEVFSSDNQKDISEYKIKGGGGTDFECIYTYLKDNVEEPPMRLVNFTDGYPCGSWGDENYCQTLFILHGTETIQPPFGNFAYYKDEK
jgi:predicted metal-dependent peptidase